MVLAATARHSGNSGQTPSQTITTDNVVETANSLLLVASAAQNDLHTADQNGQTLSGGSHTYTQVIQTALSAYDSTANFRMRGALHRVSIGGSPSAHTITVDHYIVGAGGDEGFYCVVACDITGYDVTTPIREVSGSPNIGTNAVSLSSGDSHQGTVTLPNTPISGNFVVAAFFAGADGGGGFATPTMGGQPMTPLFNQSNSWAQAGLWVREIDGTESNNIITCTDLGQSVGQYNSIAVEILAAAGGDQELNVPFHQQITSFFPITVENQNAQNLEVPHHSSEVQLFAPVIENQSTQELNVPHLPSAVQIFAPTVVTGDHQLEIPHLANVNSLFTPVVENQTAQELSVPHLDNTAQLFAVTVENQSTEELDVPFHQNVALLFTPTVFNEGEELFEPTLVGNGTLADRIMAGLIDQGFLTGTIVDREYARLLSKLSLTAPQPKSLDDLYSMAGEDNRILGIGIDELTPA